jgi:hypothetical protein
MKELYSDLIKAQTKLNNTPKDKEGYGYNYTELSTLLDYIKPILAEHNLGIVQQVKDFEDKICVTTKLIHISGDSLDSTLCLPLALLSKNNNVVQQAGATITYARRYSISALLNIASEDDTDGNLNQQEPKQQPKQEKGELFTILDLINNAKTEKELSIVSSQVKSYVWTKEEISQIKEAGAKQAKLLKGEN